MIPCKLHRYVDAICIPAKVQTKVVKQLIANIDNDVINILLDCAANILNSNMMLLPYQEYQLSKHVDALRVLWLRKVSPHGKKTLLMNSSFCGPADQHQCTAAFKCHPRYRGQCWFCGSGPDASLYKILDDMTFIMTSHLPTHLPAHDHAHWWSLTTEAIAAAAHPNGTWWGRTGCETCWLAGPVHRTAFDHRAGGRHSAVVGPGPDCICLDSHGWISAGPTSQIRSDPLR